MKRLLMLALAALLLAGCGDPITGTPAYDPQIGWQCAAGTYQTVDDGGRPVCALRR